MRHFNTEGPVKADEHYCIPPLERVDLDEILRLVEWKTYLVLHAPRQTGKTSLLKALADRLNAQGKFHCLYINVEPAQADRGDVGGAMTTVLYELSERATETFGYESVQTLRDEVLAHQSPTMALNLLLRRWTVSLPKPLVLLVDEIDTLIGDSLISVLRQLRAGYDLRPTHFPQSVILCGVRDMRDYRIFSAKDQNYTSGGSAFNIKAKSLRLGDFTGTEVRALLAQHTRETGQAFRPSAMERVWDLTQGQPWLVNALAQQACFEDRSGRDRSRAIGERAIDDAKETLILNRVTHLDQLAEQLKEGRVQRVIEPLLAGTAISSNATSDDLNYVRDLGLVRTARHVEIANPIYREVIPRRLTYVTEKFIALDPAWYVDRVGNLRLGKLLRAFQDFYRTNSEPLGADFDYKEVVPQLLLQAFLQRVVNGNGRIEREYALGRGRTDLLVLWPRGTGPSPTETGKHVIECMVIRKGRGLNSTIKEGLRQTAGYMDRSGAESGHLLVFDRRPDKSWAERIFRREERYGQARITVWGM